MKTTQNSLSTIIISIILATISSLCIVALVMAVQPPPPQEYSSQGAVDRLIAQLTLWVTILGVIVAIILAVSTGSTVMQMYRARRITIETKNDFTDKIEKEIEALKNQYKLKTPKDILGDARSEYEPMITLVRNSLEDSISTINETISKLKVETEFNSRTLSDLRSKVEKIPTEDRIINEMSKLYKAPLDLQENILR
ncbi:membrane protein, partial [Candidatus Magnetobacterium bavaricum]